MQMIYFAVFIFLVCLPTAIVDFALPKWNADDSVRIEDAYKWIHQATRGGEHAVPSEDGARTWMNNEWKSLGPTRPNEPIWEPLCKGGDVGRLNLRPFRDRKGDSESLLLAFLASSRQYRSDGAEFIAAWGAFGTQLRTLPIRRITFAEWSRLDSVMKPKNYAAVHHSNAYAVARAPAYRILTRSEMIKILPR